MVIARTDNTAPRPLASIEATRAITPLGDVRQENNDRLIRLEVGKQFQAQILSRFNDGTFMVRIADTSARIALPGGAVGDALQLTLLATDPRPTFSLDGHTTGGAAATAGTPSARIAQALYLSNAGVQAASMTGADSESGSAPASLSTAGKLVADLLASARDTGASTALVGRIPLSDLPGAAASQLASALHDSLTFSGLFYESHVHQWANGERALADLLREPQAQGSAASASAAMPEAGADVPPEVAEARRNLLEYFSTATATAAGGSADIDAGAAQMINRQLHALEQQGVRWQGELYPGQPMEWEVRRREEADGTPDSPGGADAAAHQQQWQSVVRFSLPSLGVVSATINLAGEHVQIQVRTESEGAAAALRRHGPKLASALDVAGASLDALNIRHEAVGDGNL